MDKLKQTIIDYYERCVNEHGDSAQGVNYNGRQSQYQRFEILSGIAPLGGKKVLDVACGLGHFYDFLRERGATPADYKGIDIAPSMIAYAQARHPHLSFAALDLLNTPAPAEPLYDYVIAGGIFHVRADNSDESWREFCEQMLATMFKYARQGLAFNMMTDQVDFKVDHLYYPDPCHYFNFCRKHLSRRVLLRHDYPLYEFTAYVYRTGV